MRRLRVRVLVLACWLVGIASLDWMLDSLRVSKFVYPLAYTMLLFTLIAPRLTRVPLWVLLAIPIPIHLFVRAWTHTLVGSEVIPLIITEIAIITVTILLAYWVAQSVNEFEGAVAKITLGKNSKIPEQAKAGEAAIYREVRRARNHKRPLTLMAVEVEEKSIQTASDRMMQEAQFEMMKQYALSAASKAFSDRLEDCDIIVKNETHFFVVLPETTHENLSNLIRRLRKQVSDQVGVQLRIGSASLPEDGYTMEGLVDKATKEMEADRETQPGMEQLAIKQNVN